MATYTIYKTTFAAGTTSGKESRTDILDWGYSLEAARRTLARLSAAAPRGVHYFIAPQRYSCTPPGEARTCV